MDSESDIRCRQLRRKFEARIAQLEHRSAMEQEWRLSLVQRISALETDWSTRRKMYSQEHRIWLSRLAAWAVSAVFTVAIILWLLFQAAETKRAPTDHASNVTYFNALIDARLAQRLPQASAPTSLAPADGRKLATLILFQSWLANQPPPPPAPAPSANGKLVSLPLGSVGTMASLIDSFVKGLTGTGMVLAGEADEVKSALIDALGEIGVNTAADATGAIRDVAVHGTKRLIDQMLGEDASAARGAGGYQTTNSSRGSAFAAAGGFPGQLHIYCSPQSPPRTTSPPRTQPVVRNRTPAVCEPPKHQESKQEAEEGSGSP